MQLYQCFRFQNEINYILDTLSQKRFFYVMKMSNFWGELTGTSAKKEALNCTRWQADSTLKYLLLQGFG